MHPVIPHDGTSGSSSLPLSMSLGEAILSLKSKVELKGGGADNSEALTCLIHHFDRDVTTVASVLAACGEDAMLRILEHPRGLLHCVGGT